MVEGTQQARELVGGIRVVVLSGNGVAAVAEDIDGIAVGIGVEVTHHEGGLVLPIWLLSQVLKNGFGLCLAHVGVVALAVAGVGVTLNNGTLGLEMIGHGHEGLVIRGVDWRELLR